METNTPGYTVAPDQGPVWEMEVGRPATFKLLSEQTGGNVAVFEEVVPAGGGTPLHIHRTSDEVIYVLAGEFTFKLGEQLRNGGPGTWVFIPRGTMHAWKNSGGAAGRAFYIFAPAEGAKVFEEMRHLQVPFTSIDPATVETLCQRYGYELVSFDWE
jgi:quercetin dioxygenase-like cupin family protein